MSSLQQRKREVAAEHLVQAAVQGLLQNGLDVTVDHAPGHTQGSVTFQLPAARDAGVMFSGDLLFAGSIGRTDLPGGDYETIMESLARVCLPLPDATVVLPGHGPQTTIGAERAANPFLVPLAGAGEPGVTRGL